MQRTQSRFINLLPIEIFLFNNVDPDLEEYLRYKGVIY